ncbi:MAG: hypothetical protein GF401_10980 [Chitinivibrionales bacterium]|nr:hypothetical protein [Chitinivibrionales bacterium]
MKKNIALFILCVSTISSVFGENVLNLKIGPLWPRYLLDTDTKTAWDATVEYGIDIDEKVGFGVGADFIWNRSTKDKDTLIDTSISDQQKTVQEDIKSFMFPVSGFIFVDPLSHMLVHPLLQFNIGYMPHIYSQRGKEIENTTRYYHGLYMQLALDGVYGFSENASVLAGINYQWANTRRRDKDDRNTIYYRNMSGLGFEMGFSFNF